MIGPSSRKVITENAKLQSCGDVAWYFMTHFPNVRPKVIHAPGAFQTTSHKPGQCIIQYAGDLHTPPIVSSAHPFQRLKIARLLNKHCNLELFGTRLIPPMVRLCKASLVVPVRATTTSCQYGLLHVSGASSTLVVKILSFICVTQGCYVSEEFCGWFSDYGGTLTLSKEPVSQKHSIA